MARTHLDLPALVELMTRVAQAEPHSMRSREARIAARLLYLRGLENEAIACILDMPQRQVAGYLASRGASPHERDVVAQHYAGATVRQIKTELSHETIYTILERAGVKPNVQQPRPPSGRNQRIVSLRLQGKSYAEIRDATGATTNQIRMALRSAAVKGLLPSYGQRKKGKAREAPARS